MKIYINSEGGACHFVGEIPEGWREMTAEELEQQESHKNNIKNKIINLDTDWQKLPDGIKSFFKNNYADVKAALEAGEKAKAVQIMTDIAPIVAVLPQELQSAYQDLLVKVQAF